mgnify:CR=1 FL=1
MLAVMSYDAGFLLATGEAELARSFYQRAIELNPKYADALERATGVRPVVFFTNGIDTRTQGADLVVNYESDFGTWGTVDWTLSGNFSKHRVTKIAPPPAALLVGASGPDPALFSREAVFDFQKSSPAYRFLLSGVWEIGDYTITLKETMNGPSRDYGLSPGTSTPYLVELDQSFITDLEIAYDINESFKIAIGADNLLNEYPEKIPAWVKQEALNLNSNSYVTKYSTLSPFGINGGFYYGRLTYSF